MKQVKSFMCEGSHVVLTVEFNGMVYRKTHSSEYFQSKEGHTLHRDVYEYHTGKEIPSGYIVHHKDGNKCNNEFDNLELLSSSEHTKLHRLDDKAITHKRDTPNWLINNIKAIIKSKHLKPYDVARMMQERSTFAMYKECCDINYLQRLSDVLGCDIANFFTKIV